MYVIISVNDGNALYPKPKIDTRQMNTVVDDDYGQMSPEKYVAKYPDFPLQLIKTPKNISTRKLTRSA